MGLQRLWQTYGSTVSLWLTYGSTVSLQVAYRSIVSQQLVNGPTVPLQTANMSLQCPYGKHMGLTMYLWLTYGSTVFETRPCDVRIFFIKATLVNISLGWYALLIFHSTFYSIFSQELLRKMIHIYHFVTVNSGNKFTNFVKCQVRWLKSITV
jgi:hypothetical protein